LYLYHTACAGVGGGAGGIPFEVWCRYYYPNVRDQVIAKVLFNTLICVKNYILCSSNGNPFCFLAYILTSLNKNFRKICQV